jgi:hypothetical protein
MLSLLSLFSTAEAVTYGYVYDINEMTDIAHNVIAGKVVSIETRAEEGKIISNVTVKITHNYVGNKRNTINFDVLGGTHNGVHMQVPGAPTFTVDQETLIFIEQGKIVGFGQGAYRITDDDEVVRDISNDIKEVENTINPEKDLPDETQARSCLEVKVWDDYGDEWSMRSIDVDHMGEGEFKAYPITLMQGLEYKFLACTDEKAHTVTISVYDEDGNILEEVYEEGREAVLEWKAKETEQIFLTVQATVTDEEMKQVGTSIGILYR